MTTEPTTRFVPPAGTTIVDSLSVAVIGAGTMGSGIAQVFVEAGHRVILIDSLPGAVERGRSGIERNWARAIEKGRATEADVGRFRGDLRTTNHPDGTDGVDLVVEAIFESFDAKRDLFAAIAPRLGSEAILATNTSSISVTALAAATPMPDRVVGMHFFNPVPVMKLVEVVRGERTGDGTVERVVGLATALGKTPVVVQDSPGFVANRILLPMINEAVFLLAEGAATAEGIDQVMHLGMAHPMGPLALADLIGLDVCLDIMESLQHDLGDDKYRPAPLLRRMVAAGKLGRKSGEGFYVY